MITGSVPELGDINELLQDINTLQDLDAILDRLLLIARRITRADAGSIFLRRDNELELSYIQNDTLSTEEESRERYRATGFALPISSESISGHVAATGESVLIDNAYALPHNAPYHCDASFDKRSGYRTQSVLALPVRAAGRPTIGVLQLINATDKGGSVVSFSSQDENLARLFAGQAAMAIEHARMTRALTLRMIAMASQRDPKETAAHVSRVADSSVEIYRAWASRKGEPEEVVSAFVDKLRIAAVLHDVGKVGIPDAILKKPGKLTDEEYAHMKHHTILGARLFRDRMTEVDAMAAEVALNHHERWDGKGYPGVIQDLYAPEIVLGEGKRGEDIPLAARIVALADVYDALTSRRCYKEAWSEAKARQTIEAESGNQFDPAVVAAFGEAYDVIRAVRERYSED